MTGRVNVETEQVPTPTPAKVREACRAFDNEPATLLDERALRQLWANFPENKDPVTVLLKIIALDCLYSTRLRTIEMRPLARHIAASEIDALLSDGSEHAVDIVTDCPGVRNIYSFATKFCSWHNPSAFPIWDSYVDLALWRYRQHCVFCPRHSRYFDTYAEFRTCVDAFRTHFGLQKFSYRDIDKFLWRVGRTLMNLGP